MEPRLFRKKPVVIEAIRWDGDFETQLALVTWSEAAIEGYRDSPRGPYKLSIRTLEGTMTASVGDWIVKGTSGEFYPVKPDIFEQTYEYA